MKLFELMKNEMDLSLAKAILFRKTHVEILAAHHQLVLAYAKDI